MWIRIGSRRSSRTCSSNAIQYGRERTPITIELSAAETSVTLAITNQIRDLPIATDQLATLFEPYRRGADRAHQAGGLGLGLYIVREPVRAHGGTIEATSTADRQSAVLDPTASKPHVPSRPS